MRLARVREGLEALGRRAVDFDRAYADKVKAFIDPEEYSSAPLNIARQMGADIAGLPLSERVTIEGRLPNTMSERAIEAAALLGSAGARYAAPAGLITAAGAGLADLTQNLYDSMSNTPVLPS